MEELIRFVTRTYERQISVEYLDHFHYKNEEGEEKAFDLTHMTVYAPTDMQVRFATSQMHGWLEKQSLGWR